MPRSWWDAYAASARHQWHGLPARERQFYDEQIARRDWYGFSGCIPGGALAVGQYTVPIWSVEWGVGGGLDLMTVKEDLVEVEDVGAEG